jgi:catechol 2,3-dioxygenase-like lactoylglutathione lyase family enzyme
MSAAEQVSPTTTYFENVSPILRVADVEASIKYYVEVLGFKVNWHVPGFASVGRGRCGIMLCENEQGNPGTWVWIGVGDADLLYQEYLASGAKIRHPPNNYPWAYELQVRDLDGNVLRLGSDRKQDQPLGTWLDMDGVEWTQSEGKWVRVDTAKKS